MYYEINENGELVQVRKVVMLMTDERAALLDKILLAATEENRIVTLHAETSGDKTEYISAGHDLEELKLGKLLTDQDGVFMIYPEGISFIRKHTFTQLYKEQLRKNRNKKIRNIIASLASIAAILGAIWKICSKFFYSI